jgi:hypothetical protein
MMKTCFIVLMVAAGYVFQYAGACTTAIVAGKYTVDGRPLLLKQRDTDQLHNVITAFKGDRYTFVGLVDSNDTLQAVWGGFNSAGFAIINSASYNLNVPDTCARRDAEGLVMKLALGRCATVGDFERLLESLPKPLGVNANFGVIDAKGGAAYFETGNFRYAKFDVNDPKVAPQGYLIRTNFSFTGDRALDKGLSRFEEAGELFGKAAAEGRLSCRFILNDVARCLKHGLTHTDLYSQMPATTEKPVFVAFRDFIPRQITSATIVVQGIKDNESPLLTTMWTILGSPLTSVAVPVWVLPDSALPAILKAGKGGYAPLCEWALERKKKLFPIDKAEGHDYLNLAALISGNGKGTLQQAQPVEAGICTKAELLLDRWRQSGVDTQSAVAFYNWIDETVFPALPR